MLKLIQLETKKINFKNYLGIASIIPLSVLAFTYFFACIPFFDSTVSQTDLEITKYSFVLNLAFFLNAAGFIFLGVSMMGKVVLKAYSHHDRALTLSYPVFRNRLFLAKIIFVCGFCSILGTISLGLVDGIFLLTESVAPIVRDDLSFLTFLSQFPLLINSAIFISVIILCSLFAGFKKSSLSMSILASILLFCLVGNSLSFGSTLLIFSFTVLYGVLAIFGYLVMRQQVQKMEG